MVLEWLRRTTPPWPKRVESSHQRQRSNSFQGSCHQPVTHTRHGGRGREANQSQIELDRTKRELERCKRALEAVAAKQTTLQEQFKLAKSENATLLKQAELQQENFKVEKAKSEELDQVKRCLEEDLAEKTMDYTSLGDRLNHTQSENAALREKAKTAQANFETRLDETTRTCEQIIQEWKEYYNQILNNVAVQVDGAEETAMLKNELENTRRELETSKVTMTKLQDQFTQAQRDNAAVRNQVKFVDNIEATHAEDELNGIRDAVGQISMKICESTEAALNLKISDLTADNIREWGQLRSRVSAPPISLWLAAVGSSRDLFALLDDRSLKLPFCQRFCSS